MCMPILALTATASKATQEIVSCLGMSGRCYVITKSPECDNIFLAVQRVRSDVEVTFDFFAEASKVQTNQLSKGSCLLPNTECVLLTVYPFPL